jgi:hypothetical protein
MGKHLMDHPLHRKPFAFANWKMAMTIGETLDFICNDDLSFNKVETLVNQI